LGPLRLDCQRQERAKNQRPQPRAASHGAFSFTNGVMADPVHTLHVDVVSAHESIYSGEARFVVLPGEGGEIGVYPRHTPLITRVKPGSVRIEMPDGNEEFVFIAGGILEVQPDRVTVLSDTAIRGKDLDEEKASEARRAAEEALRNASSKIDIARAQSELA